MTIHTPTRPCLARTGDARKLDEEQPNKYKLKAVNMQAGTVEAGELHRRAPCK